MQYAFIEPSLKAREVFGRLAYVEDITRGLACDPGVALERMTRHRHLERAWCHLKLTRAQVADVSGNQFRDPVEAEDVWTCEYESKP